MFKLNGDNIVFLFTMNLKIKIFLSLSLLLAVSCQDVRKKTQLEKLTALESEVYDLQKEFEEKKVDTIGRLSGEVMDVEFRIRNFYVSDTINRDLGVKINAYKSIRKRIKPLVKMYAQIQGGCHEEIKSLAQLKKDIESGAGEKERYDEYLEFEQKKVDQLKAVFEEALKEQQSILETFEKYHAELKAFSMTLKPEQQ